MYPDKFIRENVIPSVLLQVVTVETVVYV